MDTTQIKLLINERNLEKLITILETLDDKELQIAILRQNVSQKIHMILDTQIKVMKFENEIIEEKNNQILTHQNLLTKYRQDLLKVLQKQENKLIKEFEKINNLYLEYKIKWTPT